MKKLLLASLCFLLFIAQVFAQSRTVTGTVTAKEDGLPIPGVSVKLKGTNEGTQTNTAGKFTMSVPQGGVLTFSFIGYETQQTTVNSPNINVVLTLSSKQLGEVVVTGALGIKRQAKEIGYVTTQITGTNANETSVVNPINGLTGKVAGLVIQQTNEGVDPSIKVNLRGNRSIGGNNNALIVVDGVPVPSAILASLNPNDIQDYNVLNGSGAAALYGSEASNGAIVITTKKGTTDGKPIINYSNSLQLQQVANFPQIQSQYGQYGGEADVNPLTGFGNQIPIENENYGPAFDGSTVDVGIPANSVNGPQLTAPFTAQKKAPIKAFFQTGVTEQNDVSLSSGDAKNNIYIDLQNVNQTGVTPMDASKRTSARLSLTKTVGIFKVDMSTSFAQTNISENGGTDYTSDPTQHFANPATLYGDLVQFPAYLNINAPYFKDVNDQSSFGSPSNYFSAYSANPWWVVEDSRVNIQRNVFSGNLNFTLSPTKWLDASYRVSDNFGTFNQKNTNQAVNFSQYSLNNPNGPVGGASNYFAYQNPSGLIKGYTADVSGYGDGTSSLVNAYGPEPLYSGNDGMARLQGDFLLNFHHTFFNDWKTSLLLGNTIWEEKGSYTYDSTNLLSIPNFYNIKYNTGIPNLYVINAAIRQIAYFADATISYKGFATVEGTLRNDRDSRLVSTANSFYYPSIKFAFVPTEAIAALKDNNVINYLKLTADFSRVGNVSLPPYSINNTYSLVSGFPFGSTDGLASGSTNYPPGLKPETITEMEFGASLGLFRDRLNLTADYYNQKSRNQTLNITTSPTTGYSNTVINAGEVQSSGEEFSANVTVLQKTHNSIGWTLGGNLAINDSKVISLLPGVNQVLLQNEYNTNGQSIGGIYAVVGQSYPQLKVTDYARTPQGQVIVDPVSGVPTANPNLVDEGRTTPKYTLGLNTTVSYKFVTLNVVAEYRTGGVIYNGLGSYMDFGGSSAESASAGRQIFIYPNSVINTGTSASPVYTPNTTVPVYKGGYDFWASTPVNTGSPYVSSSAFWKIREVALTFKLDQFIKQTKFIKGLSFALDARNLLTFLPKSERWGDPELSDAGTGNGVGASGSFELPSTRIFGGKLQVTF